MYFTMSNCCGLKLIENLRDHDTAEEAFRAFKKDRTKGKAAYFIFSMPDHCRIGEEFEAFINKEKLGTVIKTTPTTNPNSGNTLVVYVWTVNWKAVHAWGRPQKIKDAIKDAVKRVTRRVDTNPKE